MRGTRGGLQDPAKYAIEGANKRYEDFIVRWKAGLESGMKGATSISAHIRKYLFLKYSHSCARCGGSKVNHYTGKVPLEVEHLDGNFKNNAESNLELICPNCHSLTSTFRSLNRGSGRPRGVATKGTNRT